MAKPFNPFSLEGKNILISGASSGIGQQCAIDCSKMGAKIVAIGRNQEHLDETLKMLEGQGHATYSYDLSQTDGIKELIAQIVFNQGRLDGLVCAAGAERTAPAKLLKPTDYEELFRVNTLSAFELAKHATSVKFFNSRGGVIFISSITSVIARIGTAAYSASKGALVSGARVLAAELAKRRIRINCISPGTILTPMMQRYLSQLSEDDYKKRIAGFPLGIGETTDISLACVYLLSDAGRWVTGQNLIIDGGFTMM